MERLLTLILLFSVAVSLYTESHRHAHGYHIHKFRIVPTSPPPAGLINAMNETMEIEFHAGEYVFNLDLTLKKQQWAPDSKIILEEDEHGNPTKTLPLYHRGYTGTASVMHGSQVEFGRASVTFWQDRQRASLAVVTEHDIYNVEMIEQKEKSLPMKGHNTGGRMYMTKKSDRRGHKQSATREYPFGSRRRLTQQFNANANDAQKFFFQNCFDAQMTTKRAIKIDLVSDASFESQVKGSVNAQQQMIADLNKASDLIYKLQLRVWLLAGNIYVGGASKAPPCSGYDSGTRLTKFLEYRKAGGQKNNRALSHLYTNCHPPPGTVGLAYVGAICNVDNGGGWSNFMPGGGTWEVVAHEIGHNFGSPHSFDNGQGTTGGIMDYGDGKYPAPGSTGRVYAFNPLRKNDICGHIAETFKGNWWDMAPADCWTTFAGTSPVPPPTPQPTKAGPPPTSPPTTKQPTSSGPQPTPQPTPPTQWPTKKPTVSTSTPGTTCTGTTYTASWGMFTYSTATCQQYVAALRLFKPCIPQVISCSAKATKDSWWSYVELKLKWLTSDALAHAFKFQVYEDGIVKELKNMPGIVWSRRRRLNSATAPPTHNNQSSLPGVPVITYQWIRNPDMSYTTCSPSCGNFRYQLESYVCQQIADNRMNGGTIDKLVVPNEHLCGLDMKSIGNSRKCGTNPVVPCPACGVSTTVGANQICSTNSDPTCCAAGCQSYNLAPPSCLMANRKIDAAFMSCLNDAAKTGCHLYVFQGEYFMKYYAPHGSPTLYDRDWKNGVIKHKGIFQPDWTTLTAVAGGRSGQVWVFNGLSFMQIDYSNENQGKVMARGTVDGTWAAPADFAACGSVTAADVVSERLIQLFCNHMFIYVYIPTMKANATIYPADIVYSAASGLGVNAFYFDNRDMTYRVFRANVQSVYRQGGLAATQTAAFQSIFGSGVTPQISTSTCAVADPECITCTGVNKCTACNPGYKVLVNRCIPEETLVDMTFDQNLAANDAFYSSDPILKSATFVTDHGNRPNGAMEFTPTTHVMAHAPTLTAGTVKDFRIEVFYKPSSVTNRQTLITIDSRYQLDLKHVPNTSTMKLFVRFDKMAFECYVPNPLKLNKWNLIAVEFTNRQIITSVNGFQHNRGFTQVGPGGPTPLGLTFQNVTIGAKQGGLSGALDSLLIKGIPVQGSQYPRVTSNTNEEAPWVIPLVVAVVVLSVCLVIGVSYLAYQREMCGRKDNGGNEMQTAFLDASGHTTGGNYVAME